VEIVWWRGYASLGRGSSTPLKAGFAPFTTRPLYGIDAVRKAAPDHFFPDFHADAIGNAAGGEILGTNQRNHAIGFQIREGPIAASDDRFGGEAPIPEVSEQVVSDFVEMLALNFLADDAAIADQFPGGLRRCRFQHRRFENHPPKADPVVFVPLAVAGNPLFDSGTIIGRGIVTHGFGITEDAGQSIRIFGSQFAQHQARCFKDRHC